MINSSIVCQQKIRSYIRLFPSLGIDPAQPSQYQIIGTTFSQSDGGTFLRKNPKMQTHSFNYIFPNQFQNQKQIQHMNIIDDYLDGKNQTIIAEIAKQNMTEFIMGTADDPSLIVEIVDGIFKQVMGEEKEDQIEKQGKQKKKKFLKKEQNMTVTILSSEGSSNKFIDLILGQRLSFYSKKDMDEYKQFYSKEITNIRQFLILLKISILHYQECCQQGDPIVFRICTDFYEEVTNKHYSTVINLVICQMESRIAKDIFRKVQISTKNGLSRGEDHGSLANYVENYLKKGKLVYIYGMPYRKSNMEASVPMFESLSLIRNSSIKFLKSVMKDRPEEKIEKLNSFCLPKYRFGIRNFIHRQINEASKLLGKLSDFFVDTQIKWKSYCEIYNELLQTQKDFYEKQRFPISLEIQDINFKSFLISKVYRLSQTYQMDDQTTNMQRLRTIKNQIIISLKAIPKSKQFIHLFGSPNTVQFSKYFQICLNLIEEQIKLMFGIKYRSVQVYQISLQKDIKFQSILDNKYLKDLSIQFQTEAKKAKQKEEVLLRKIDVQNINPLTQMNQRLSAISSRNEALSGTQTFQLFQNSRKKNGNRSIVQSISLSKSGVECPSILKHSMCQIQRKNGLDFTTLLSHQYKQLSKSPSQYSLPKIAVIHRKKQRL